MNEAGTKGGEHNLVALLEQMLIVPKGQWNGGGTGVAIMVDIDHHAVEIELGTLGYSLDDTEVGLLTSSSCHPKIFVKEFSYFLMSCHQHCLGVNLLVQR